VHAVDGERERERERERDGGRGRGGHTAAETISDWSTVGELIVIKC